MAPGGDKIRHGRACTVENRRLGRKRRRIRAPPMLDCRIGLPEPNRRMRVGRLLSSGCKESGIMSIVSQTVLDSLFAGYFNQERGVPNDAELQEMATRCGLSVDQVKDAFAEKWRAAGNLDDPFGRNPEDEEEDDE